jgi:hypothetical protein
MAGPQESDKPAEVALFPAIAEEEVDIAQLGVSAQTVDAKLLDRTLVDDTDDSEATTVAVERGCGGWLRGKSRQQTKGEYEEA